jgi:flagellar basal body-associated protein FliL
MNEQNKKILTILAVLAAVGIAGASAFFFMGQGSEEKMQVVDTVPMAPGQKSMKQLEMEAMRGGEVNPDTGAGGAPAPGERDLGGGL